MIVLYNFLVELQEFDTNMDNDSVSHLFTESPDDGREPDDIHMSEDSDASENESDSSCDFKVCRILIIYYFEIYLEYPMSGSECFYRSLPYLCCSLVKRLDWSL